MNGIKRFARWFILKPDCNVGKLKDTLESKWPFFSSGSAICGCDTRGKNGPSEQLESDKTAVAAVRVRILLFQERNVGVAAARVPILRFCKVYCSKIVPAP